MCCHLSTPFLWPGAPQSARRLAEAGTFFSVPGPNMHPIASTRKLGVSLSNLSGPVPSASVPEELMIHIQAAINFPFEHFLTWSLHPTSNRFSEHSPCSTCSKASQCPSGRAQVPPWSLRGLPYSPLQSLLTLLSLFLPVLFAPGPLYKLPLPVPLTCHPLRTASFSCSSV